ncbi:MAG TPA: hypothetical protein QF753_17590 [Victivallales bacterium]|nr:hypothetical protein [Victivallales bacterium]
MNKKKLFWCKPRLHVCSSQTVHGYCNSNGSVATVERVGVCTGGSTGTAQTTCNPGSDANELCNTGGTANTPAFCSIGSYANQGACLGGTDVITGSTCSTGNTASE